MIIIHIITAFGIGGAEKLLLNVINRQIEENEVHLIYFKDYNELLNDLNANVIVKQIPFSVSIIKDLKKYFKAINPDIIHTHLGHADLLGLWAAKNCNAKLFCTMHSISFKNNFLDYFIFKIYKLFLVKLIKHGHVISISKAVENHVLNTLEIPIKNSHLLYNAIDQKNIKRTNVNDQFNVLFVGRLEKEKSVDTLIKSFKKIVDTNLNKKINLTILGDGKLKNNLENLVTSLNLQTKVSFKGNKKNVDDYYAKADVFILPSISEGFGIVILEAFRAKTAVIASNIEGPAELIKDNYNGLLFEPKNVIELTSKIQYLIDNKNKRDEIAKNGHTTFSNDFSIVNYVIKLNNLYLNA